MRTPGRGRLLTLLCLVALAGSACATAGGEGPAGGSPDDEGSAGPPLDGELVVAAAASLTDVFEDLAAELEAANPDLTVLLDLGSSATLATRIVEGAPVDVFASADERQTAVVAGAGLAGDAVPFATNELTIAVAPGNPLDIEQADDLARDDVVLVLAAPEVPAGRYTAQAFAAAGVAPEPASFEVDVRAALGKVVTGEADAAVVYRSDVVAADDAVDAVTFPAASEVPVTYPVVVLDDARHPRAARAFVELLRSDAGAEALSAAGFGPVERGGP